MSGTTPQQRTRENLTVRGYLVGTVEKKKKFPDRKKSPCRACNHQPMIEISSDLWEVFDIVAVKPIMPQRVLDEARKAAAALQGITSIICGPDIIFVQTTSRNNHSTRRNKILASMEAKLVLLSGARILIQSWRQPDGARTAWQSYDEWITLDMYDQAPHYPNTVAELVELRKAEKRQTLPLAVDFEEIPF